jgi:hypothetical protein
LKAKAKTMIARWKWVTSDMLLTRKKKRTTEVKAGIHVLNRMLTPGRPGYVRIS